MNLSLTHVSDISGFAKFLERGYLLAAPTNILFADASAKARYHDTHSSYQVVPLSDRRTPSSNPHLFRPYVAKIFTFLPSPFHPFPSLDKTTPLLFFCHRLADGSLATSWFLNGLMSFKAPCVPTPTTCSG